MSWFKESQQSAERGFDGVQEWAPFGLTQSVVRGSPFWVGRDNDVVVPVVELLRCTVVHHVCRDDFVPGLSDSPGSGESGVVPDCFVDELFELLCGVERPH